MKDVVFLVVDSLMADKVFNKSNNLLMPFLDSIKINSLCGTNVYSQGPFTEAGTRGLLTASDTLDNEGYFLRYEKSNTFLTKIFNDLNFDTFSLIYPTCLYSNWIINNMSQVYYTSGFLFNVFESQKIKHYLPLYNNKKLDERDWKDLSELFEVIFYSWIHFVDPKNKESRSLLERFDSSFDYENVYNTLCVEKEKFEKNRIDYIDTYFRENKNHILNRIKHDYIKNFIQNDAISKAFSYNKAFVKELNRKQFWCNIKNNKIPKSAFKEIPTRIKKNGINKYTFGEFGYFVKTISRGNDVDICKNGHNYKPLLSAKTQLDKILSLLKDEHNKPRFITAHIEEPHYFTTYFSFDSNDSSLISKELSYAYEYVKSVGNDYAGLISYDLSLRYVDNLIKEFCFNLEKSGRLDNTIIVITADHGSSYNCYPLRYRIVNNCHTENFKIPFIIYDKNSTGKEINKLASAIDVIPTVLDYLNLSLSYPLKGKSLLNDSFCRKYVTTEYMGPGCPDMRRNKTCITIRNNKYLIAYEGLLTEKFSDSNITDIYDLEVDNKELNNIKLFRNVEINELIFQLKKRFEDIQENNKVWLSNKII